MMTKNPGELLTRGQIKNCNPA